jgi:competence protein ComGF
MLSHGEFTLYLLEYFACLVKLSATIKQKLVFLILSQLLIQFHQTVSSNLTVINVLLFDFLFQHEGKDHII